MIKNEDKDIEGLKVFFAKQKKVKFKNKEVIIKEGDLMPCMYYVQSGFIRVYVVSKNGHEITLGIHGKGGVFPIDAFRDQESAYYFEAVGETELLRASIEDMRDYIMKNPSVSFVLLRIGALTLQKFFSKVKITILSSAQLRILLLFKDLGDNYGIAEKGSVRIPFKITHRVIGSMVGLTRESTSLHLKALERRSAITRLGDNYVIHDFKKLSKEIDGMDF
jgi:CRP/FNR family transcriptional regulator, cyclic AMP receptor protein